MVDYIFAKTISNRRQLCISPLPDRTIEATLPLTKANRLAYYLYELDESDAENDILILARIVSEDAAFKLKDVLKMNYLMPA